MRELCGPGDHEIAALDVRVRRVGAEVRAAGVPAEVVQLVAAVGEVGPADQPAEARAGGVGVHHAERVALAVAGGEQRHVGQLLGRRLGGEARGGIERRVGAEARHGSLLGRGGVRVLTPTLRQTPPPAATPRATVGAPPDQVA